MMSEDPAFQADCAGSTPVTRSAAMSQDTVHRCPAAPFMVRLCDPAMTILNDGRKVTPSDGRVLRGSVSGAIDSWHL